MPSGSAFKIHAHRHSGNNLAGAHFVVSVNTTALLGYFVFAQAISIGVYMVYGVAFIVAFRPRADGKPAISYAFAA